MKALRRFFQRMAAPLTRARDEERLHEEIAGHIALETGENLRAGLPAAEARRRAVLKFGAVEALKDEYRDQRGLPVLEALFQDSRHALRRLRHSPVFTLTTVLTLALGIGATTAIFTLAHAVLLRSLPVAKPEQLLRLGKRSRCCVVGGYSQTGGFSLVSYELYRYLRDHTQDFEELAGFQADGNFLGVRRAGSAQPAGSYFGRFVSGNYFTMFGIGAYAGRALAPADDRAGAPPAAVISYQTWQQKFGADASVVGAVFTVNNQPFTIVGVAPPGFYGDQLSTLPPDFYVPLAAEPLVKGNSSLLEKADVHWLNVIGRLRPGAVASAVEANMQVELQQWLKSHFGEMGPYDRRALPKQTLYLSPGGAGASRMRQQYKEWLELLLIVSGLVLLIVCANVANLMLVRGMEQRQRISLSLALGAGPGRVMREAMAESLLLSLLGGAAGLAVSFAGARLILHFAFEGADALAISAAPSWPVLWFALGISLLTGAVFGMAPAWMALRIDPVEALRGAHRSTRRAGSGSRRALVVAQAALSLVLLCASGLLTEALLKLEHQDFGFRHEGRSVLYIDPVLAGYRPEQLDLLYRRVQETFSRLPGVESVACGLYTPMSGDNWDEGVYIEGKPAPAQDADNGSSWARVTPGFFDVIGNPIVRGRPITAQDTPGSRHVAVVNEAFARKFLPHEDPIGRRFGKGDPQHAGDYEIVGVTKDARFQSYNLEKPVVPFFFVPETQSSTYTIPVDASTEVRSHYLHALVVRMRPGSTLSEPVARGALASVDPNLPITRQESMSRQVENNFSQQRLIAQITALFGSLALVLASIGIYGVTAYGVESRTNEIGVRMALGAGRRQVVALILRGAAWLIGVGLVLGLPLSAGAGRLLGSQLYGVDPFDPVVMAVAIAALGFSGIAAALIPAYRASSIAPLQALRME